MIPEADPVVVLREELRQSFELLQQQLAVIERQLDGITILANRTFTSTLSPESRIAERERGIKLAKEIAEKAERELNQQIEARAARGVPDDGDAVTPEDLEQADRDSLLT